MVSATLWHCWIVEWACLNPNWWFGIQSCGFDALLILLNINFSNIFEIVGSRLMGRYEVTSIGFFPGLGIVKICACFSALGQYSSLIMALSMYWRFCSHFWGNSSSIVAVIRSIPGAFLWFNFLFSFFISFRVNGFRRSCWCMGVSSSCSTSWFWYLLCGVNTSERCTANSSAFSLSLFAQSPGV